jgi:uncharacterized protein
MEIIGYGCALLVGISLGVFGSGGSILTVPILVYLLQVNPVEATGYSLFVVGVTSSIGCATYIRKKLADIRIAFIFAVPSIASVFLMRNYVMPLMPGTVISLDHFKLSKEVLIMVLYAILMVVVAYSMIRQSGIQAPAEKNKQPVHYPGLFAIGFLSGILTGVFGVGGGFIIVPALVLLARVPIRMSVGTSLLIIAFNSLSGFGVEILAKHEIMNYHVLLLFTLLAITGLFIGFPLSLKLYPAQMKRIFGWFILVMATGILIKEIFLSSS